MTNYNKCKDISIAEIAKFIEDTINAVRKQNEQNEGNNEQN